MLAILQFIFSGFWIFAGTLVLLVVLLEGTADIILAARAPKKLSK